MTDSPQLHVCKPAVLVALTMMLLGACLLAGCERRVVGVKDRWSGGGSPQMVDVKLREPKKKGFFEGMGDLLFGWTRHLLPEKKAEPPTRQPVPGFKAPTPATNPAQGEAPRAPIP